MANAWHPLVRQLSRGILQLGLDAASILFARKKAVRYTSAGQSVRGSFYVPRPKGPSPGVLLLHTAGGLTRHEHAMASRLAREGYAALVISYSKRTSGAVTRDDLQRARLQQIVADGFSTLQAHPSVLASQTAVIGLSLGGYFATHLATAPQETAPRAVVVFYGIYPLSESEVAGLAAPLLILQGEDDHADFIAQAKNVEELSGRHGKTCELVLYPGAGHQFDLWEPGSTAARDSWNRTLAFLSQHLKA